MKFTVEWEILVYKRPKPDTFDVSKEKLEDIITKPSFEVKAKTYKIAFKMAETEVCKQLRKEKRKIGFIYYVSIKYMTDENKRRYQERLDLD